MRAKYLKQKSFFNYEAKRGDSMVWRGILNTKEAIVKWSCYSIGDG